jgi:hypothetical protein
MIAFHPGSEVIDWDLKMFFSILAKLGRTYLR